MCMFCGGQCSGAVEYIVNLAAILGAPYCIILYSKLKSLKYNKQNIKTDELDK